MVPGGLRATRGSAMNESIADKARAKKRISELRQEVLNNDKYHKAVLRFVEGKVPYPAFVQSLKRW